MGLIVTCEPDGRLTPGQLPDFILELDEETMAALQGQHRELAAKVEAWPPA